jgi:hypothetical protein
MSTYDPFLLASKLENAELGCVGMSNDAHFCPLESDEEINQHSMLFAIFGKKVRSDRSHLRLRYQDPATMALQ